ncbi:MAG: transposase [Planctomycetes bacterium]|nr:transposase [Planctomycetota bacterium]
MASFLVPRRSNVIERRGTLEDALPEGHWARFIWRMLESTDFTELELLYPSVLGEPGRPPYHPRIIAALWIYGMTQGLSTATAISRSCTLRDDFRWLAGGLSPCDQTLLNFLTVARDALISIRDQVLKEMHRAGHVDLSAVSEDGTKLRANASGRSFHTGDDIAIVIEDLKKGIAKKLEDQVPPEAKRQQQIQVRAFNDRLQRAEQAITELGARSAASSEEAWDGTVPQQCEPCKFGRDHFRHDAQKDVMMCPAGQELALLGVYRSSADSKRFYRVYRRKDCTGCVLKAQCGEGKGRRLKVPVEPAADPSAEACSEGSTDKPPAPAPRASLTDPECRLMLATSDKRIEPSCNADITVTRHGVIVSQFLTQQAVDYEHFKRACPTVLALLGRPDAWIGDGHYTTQANLILASRLGVTLYGPVQSGDAAEQDKYSIRDFRHDADRDILICPAGKELQNVGTRNVPGRPYDLYGRSDCTECPLKSRCTITRARTVRRPHNLHLILALEARMKDVADNVTRLRSSTVEPVNGQLKQHGLARFHVRGLSRCTVVLTLACIAHNLMKWKAREQARVLRAAS